MRNFAKKKRIATFFDKPRERAKKKESGKWFIGVQSDIGNPLYELFFSRERGGADRIRAQFYLPFFFYAQRLS